MKNPSLDGFSNYAFYIYSMKYIKKFNEANDSMMKNYMKEVLIYTQECFIELTEGVALAYYTPNAFTIQFDFNKLEIEKNIASTVHSDRENVLTIQNVIMRNKNESIMFDKILGCIDKVNISYTTIHNEMINHTNVWILILTFNYENPS